MNLGPARPEAPAAKRCRSLRHSYASARRRPRADSPIRSSSKSEPHAKSQRTEFNQSKSSRCSDPQRRTIQFPCRDGQSRLAHSTSQHFASRIGPARRFRGLGKCEARRPQEPVGASRCGVSRHGPQPAGNVGFGENRTGLPVFGTADHFGGHALATGAAILVDRTLQRSKGRIRRLLPARFRHVPERRRVGRGRKFTGASELASARGCTARDAAEHCRCSDSDRRTRPHPWWPVRLAAPHSNDLQTSTSLPLPPEPQTQGGPNSGAPAAVATQTAPSAHDEPRSNNNHQCESGEPGNRDDTGRQSQSW